MPNEFVGAGLPLDVDGVSEVTDRMGVHAPELWAVLTVETRGSGFLPDRRPYILYERHIFSKETNRKFDAAHPDISNETPVGRSWRRPPYDRIRTHCPQRRRT